MGNSTIAKRPRQKPESAAHGNLPCRQRGRQTHEAAALSDTVATPSPWTLTTKRQPCPVCHRAGCLASARSDPAAVVCRNVENAQPIGTVGYLHVLRDSPAWSAWSRSLARLKRGGTR